MSLCVYTDSIHSDGHMRVRLQMCVIGYLHWRLLLQLLSYTNTNNMIIAVDLDGCVADFNSTFAKLLMKIDPSMKFDIYADNFPERWDWWDNQNKDAVERAWTEARNSGVFWRSLFPYSNGWDDLKALEAFRNNGNDVYFLSARPGKTAKHESEQWLRGHGFSDPTVVIVGKPVAESKDDVCYAVGADLLIDDKPKNILNLTSAKPYLLKRPYNKEYWDAGLNAVSTVREVLDEYRQ